MIRRLGVVLWYLGTLFLGLSIYVYTTSNKNSEIITAVLGVIWLICWLLCFIISGSFIKPPSSMQNDSKY